MALHSGNRRLVLISAPDKLGHQVKLENPVWTNNVGGMVECVPYEMIKGDAHPDYPNAFYYRLTGAYGGQMAMPFTLDLLADGRPGEGEKSIAIHLEDLAYPGDVLTAEVVSVGAEEEDV